jgi:hypothetical protein
VGKFLPLKEAQTASTAVVVGDYSASTYTYHKFPQPRLGMCPHFPLLQVFCEGSKTRLSEGVKVLNIFELTSILSTTMPSITSFEILDSEIQKVAGQPTVLEALWDGDTQGWFLILNLYFKTGKFFWKRETIKHLGIVSFGGDMRLFNGQVPLWPEAELTKEWGQKVAEKYGLTFYFPSDKEPDDNCPSWTQRHLAIQCADCGKSIIPTTSIYLPKDICYSCHLTRERNERIKRNEFYKDGIYGTYQAKDSLTSENDSFISQYLNELVNLTDLKDEINVVIFSNVQLMELKGKLYSDIKSTIANYQKSNLNGERRKFGSFELIKFEGNEYEFEHQFNENHRALSYLIHSYQTFEKAELEGWTYSLHIIKGLTNRDDLFLRFINFVAKGSTSIKEINQRYVAVLTELEILDTLKKLERLGCIEISNENLKITSSGKGVL